MIRKDIKHLLLNNTEVKLKKTKYLANIMLICSLVSATVILLLSYLNTNSYQNAIYVSIIAVIGISLGYLYTAKPLKLSARKGLGELTIFLAFGPLLTLGTGFAISTDTISLFSNEFYNLIFLGVPVGLLTTNILFINQFPDYKSDKLAGKNNLVVLFGKKSARWIYLIFLVLTYTFMFYYVDILNENISNFSLTLFYIFNSILIIIGLFIVSHIFKNYDNRSLVRSNINTIYYQMLFSILYIIILNPFYLN